MKKKILYDVFFYLGFPLLVWNFGRGMLGNYAAILVGLFPAVIYAVADFIKTRQLSITGLFFLFLIVLNIVFDLLSHSALEELWNEVYVSCICIGVYVISMLISRPVGMYFFVDYAYAKGIPRKASIERFRRKENFYHFQWFTAFLMTREFFIIGYKSFMINKHGLQDFNTMETVATVVKIVFTVLMILYIVRILKTIKQNTPAAAPATAN